jgi:ABC-type Fe3+ transport system permease subunit
MIVFVFIAVAILIASIVLLIGEVRAYLTRTRNKQQVCALKQALKSSELNWASIAWMISLTLLCVGILTNGYLYPSAALIPIGSGPASLHPMDLRAYNIQYGLLLWLVFKTPSVAIKAE